MTFTYRFEPEDWVRWCQYYTRHSSNARRRRALSIVCSGVVYFAVALIVSEQVHKAWATATALLFAVAFCVLTPAYIDRRTGDAFRAEASNPRLQGSFGAYRLTVSPAGLSEEAPGVKSQVGWESVREIVLDKDHVFIVLSTGQAAVIGRSSYAGPVAFDRIPEAVTALRQRGEGQSAPRNGGPAAPISNLTVTEGPPSVS